MENFEKKRLKPWIANLIVFFAELIIIILYFYLGWKGIEKVFKGDIAGGFHRVEGVIWFLNIAIIVLSVLIFTIKPLRTKTNIITAIWNLIWIGFNIYLIYS
jgi:uncharacterized membrane protein